tara:strand:+ start:197 stop:976 length:780 start_codon:yes stop_codon:yes gene_type:complete
MEVVKKIPKFIIIVPYRDRENQKIWFINNVKRIAKILPYFEVYFIHQNDKRIFNRGAMKNFGFLFIKEKYPDNYKDITLVFHDVDTFPSKHILLNYITHHKYVKHFYGFKHTLGGIVSIKGRNFESVNGFPNFWGWGFEDNVLQTRCLDKKYTIDRKQFYPINDENIHHFQDERYKLFNSKNIERVNNDSYNYGITNLNNYRFNCELIDDTYIFMVHIDYFNCEYNPKTEFFQTHDLAKGNVIMKTYKQPSMKMNFKNL